MKFNKLIKISIFIFIVLISLFSVIAEPVLEIEMTAFNDRKTAVINDFRVFDAYPSVQNSLKNPNAQIHLLNKNNQIVYKDELTISFYVYDIGFVNDIFIYRKLPYSNDVKYLKFYFDDELLLNYELNLCNENNFCDSFENYLSCSLDCPLDEIDNVCVNRKDGICDPDCFEGYDIDCVELTPEDDLENITDKETDEVIENNNLNLDDNSGNLIDDSKDSKKGVIFGLIGFAFLVVIILMKIIISNSKREY